MNVDNVGYYCGVLMRSARLIAVGLSWPLHQNCELGVAISGVGEKKCSGFNQVAPALHCIVLSSYIK